MTWEAMPWKRWSLPYRIGILFALMMLLQGASCLAVSDLIPSFTVPGAGGKVYAEVFRSANGVPYYQVLVRDDGKTRYFTYVYPGNPQYDAIVNFFRSHPEITVYDFFAPASVPGAAGSPPPPPLQ
jgi:hypothetical protein